MYKRILVPIDGSPTSIRGLDEAIALAKLCGASLRLVHVLDRVPMPAGETYTVDVFGLLREAGERIVQQAKARAAAASIRPRPTRLAPSSKPRGCRPRAGKPIRWRLPPTSRRLTACAMNGPS